ncbi:HAMP domain-containing sensor histidine kinase [uncultured Chitinophaga sp.]|uniref:sensor histidine kinase n=1 Tax=uncultured Chitinophaga sp. TaxID=339340 RepID=UPI0025EF83D4|nr:HAMP domain-containing sensor histidine kinase [uncultured Chitinophaga sp.]
MKIKFKIALYYTVSAAVLLITFATLAYYFSVKERSQEFYDRLEYRARSIANVLDEGVHLETQLLKRLDKTTFQDLYQETIVVYNGANDVVYASQRDTAISIKLELLSFIRRNGIYHFEKDNAETVGIYHTTGKEPLIVIVSAVDKYGLTYLESLRQILLVELAVAVLLLVGVGYFFARNMMQPINQLVTEVNTINANNLQDNRVSVAGRDEIAQLGANFNTMLQRLSNSFDLQKSFVSNASHELRTPLASIISQLQVTTARARSTEDYELTLNSVLEDAQNLSDLTNGLLQLAQSDMNQQQSLFRPVRIDELLLELPNLISLKQKGARVDIEFLQIPDNEALITCNGNDSLLKVLFLNLVDNACKFSPDHSANVTIDTNEQMIVVRVQDKGMGIPGQELGKVFEPFYRAQNASAVRGHGLGLSICKRIVGIHEGAISVSSVVGEGTVFEVKLPHLQ